MITSLQTPPRPTPPARRWPVPRRVVAAAVLLAATSTGLLIATLDRPAREQAAADAGPELIPAAPPLADAPGGTAPSAVPTGTAVPPAPVSYQLLWPFGDEARAASWQRAYRQGGHQPWHVDPAATALGFAGHLGYAGIDRAVRTTVDGRSAHVAVGFRAPDGRLHTAADVHLVRLGSGSDAPWEVVGTRDTTLTLTRPGYGTTVTSPLTVGGRITGVDERITVRLYALGGELPVGSVAGVPAGGQGAAWSVPVTFQAAPGAVLTVAAATGGHLAAVERFAVTGVRVGGTG